MIIRRLTLFNIGQYKGEVTFDLSPEDTTRPIVLVMGNNGAGKTTIQKSIRLCFYGKQAIGPRVSEREYLLFLQSLGHKPRSPDEPRPTHCSISVDFNHSTARANDEYRIVRSWQVEGRKWNETVAVARNGKPLSDIEMEHWPAFLAELVPPGIADLFFFDGEDIQELAEESSNRNAKSAVQVLLGLDLVERLDQDLRIYADRLSPPPKDKDAIAVLLAERDGINDEISRASQQLANLLSQLDLTNAKIEEAEQEFAELGGLYAVTRNQIEQVKQEKEKRLDDALNDFRRACQDALPFVMVTKLLSRVQQQIELESHNEALTTTVNTLEGYYSRQSSDGTRDFHHDVLDLIPLLVGHLRAETQSDLDLIHDANEAYRRRVSLVYREVQRYSEWIGEHAACVESLQEELSHHAIALSRAPDEQTIEPVFTKIRELEADRAQLQVQIESAEGLLKGLETKLGQVERRLAKIRDKQKKRVAQERRLELVTRVSDVLGRYQEELLQHKTRQLEVVLLECLDQLLRKKGRFTRCEIDSKTFEPQFHDGNRWVPKSELSAGEKQLYATAFLWSLMVVSGRKIPLVIDTPLARLDLMHRKHVVEEFFSKASHQVVVLATDGEVDPAILSSIHDRVSRIYELQHDQANGSTTVRLKTQVEVMR